jgi:integrase
VATIQKAWTFETFRKYRRTLTRLQKWLTETGTPEGELLDRARADVQIGNFITSLSGELSTSVSTAMLGHMRRILRLLNSDGSQGLLATLAHSLNRSTPVPSRKYDAIWNIDALLTWIRTHWADNDTLSMDDLQTKTMIIVMIFSACRLVELGRMERPQGATAEAVTIVLPTVQKQSQAKKEQLVVRKIPQTPLCPVGTVLSWLRRSVASPDGLLFHAHPRGGDPRAMKTPDICPRFLRTLRRAGIPSHYTAYSIKHAVVTKLYRMGATDEQVVAYGHWAKGSLTPRKWYNIATLEEEWLGTKLLGESMGISESHAIEKFDSTYVPPARTVARAEARARTAEALATPVEELQQSEESPDRS